MIDRNVIHCLHRNLRNFSETDREMILDFTHETIETYAKKFTRALIDQMTMPPTRLGVGEVSIDQHVQRMIFDFLDLRCAGEELVKLLDVSKAPRMTMEEIDHWRSNVERALENWRALPADASPETIEAARKFLEAARLGVDQRLAQWWEQDCKEVR